jgi:hypothetical protein
VLEISCRFGKSYARLMCDLESIDAELRPLAAVLWSIREHGGEPSSRQADALLDERFGLGLRPEDARQTGCRRVAEAADEIGNLGNRSG